MTISKKENKVVYIGTGSKNDYDYNFLIPVEESCVVYKVAYPSNEESKLVQGVDYTVSGIGQSSGGTVTLTENLEDQYKLIINRENTFLQQTDLTNQESFFLEKIEDSLDILTIYTQQLLEAQDRSLQLPLSATGDFLLPETDRNDKLIGFDSSGNPVYYTPQNSVGPATDTTQGIIRVAFGEEPRQGLLNDVALTPQNNPSRVVETIAELRTITGLYQNQSARVLGYNSVGDGGGGRDRYWSEGQPPGTYTDNGGSIIVPTGGDGSAAWLFIGNDSGLLRINTVTFTSSGTYSKPDGLLFAIVEAVGGGGGGGGCSTTGAGASSVATGGSGAGYSKKTLLAGDLAISETVIIGAGGAGGTIGNNPGVDGGNTSFGTFITCTGGKGGNGDGTSSSDSGTLAKVGSGSTGGDINIQGGGSGEGLILSGSRASLSKGGDTALGFGGLAVASGSVNGSGYGSGGSGGNVGPNTTGIAGGDGADGVVIITEYYGV